MNDIPISPLSPLRRAGRPVANAELAGQPLQLPLLRKDPFSLERQLLPHTDGLAPTSVSAEALARFDVIRAAIHLQHPVNAVALFYELDGARPADYQATSVQQVRDWLDEGTAPMSPGISDFVWNYWNALSYGNFTLGMNTPRDETDTPIVPTIATPAGGPDDWPALINACLDKQAEACWKAGGSLVNAGRRYLVSLVLVQHYETHASANFEGYRRTVDGVEYEIGDITHLRYDLRQVEVGGTPIQGRHMWSTVCHEMSHNFLQYVDLYGPQGCTGYWDLLGDNTSPGRMSEVSSYMKVRVGWLDYRRVIEGPTVAMEHIALRPYTTTGDAIKVVPDPAHTPHEYFLLEFRRSTGDEAWRPDGGLTQSGLFITHINDRLGVPGHWLGRSAPFFDPEFADYSDNGAALWTGLDRLDGVVFPQAGGRDRFTANSLPSSDLYGGRPSGLSITNIRAAGDSLSFDLELQGRFEIGWQVGERDRAVAGRFSAVAGQEGDEIAIRNDDDLSLLVHREAQWLVASRQTGRIGDWALGADDRHLAVDVDGDGRDQLFIRSPEWAGLLAWDGAAFGSRWIGNDRIDDWNLGPDDRELAGRFTGVARLAPIGGGPSPHRGPQQIAIRSPEWLGLLAWDAAASRMRAISVQGDRVDDWNLGPEDREAVGKFTGRDHDELLVHSPEYLGVLHWDAASKGFRSRSVQHDRIGDWNLGPQDQLTVADLDGDGIDEVYIRSAAWAGVLKWRDGGFGVVWMTGTPIAHISGKAEDGLALAESDRSFGGRFLPKRDGILHVGSTRLALLTLEDGRMVVRQHRDSPIDGRWRLGPSDHHVLGTYERRGPDVGKPDEDFVADGLTGTFIHNAWGTGAIGVNYLEAGGDFTVEQLGVSWVNAAELMHARTGHGIPFNVQEAEPVVIADPGHGIPFHVEEEPVVHAGAAGKGAHVGPLR